MPKIELTDDQVATLRNFDLFAMRLGATEYRRVAIEQENNPLALALRTVCENLAAVIDALPREQIEPQADWSKLDFAARPKPSQDRRRHR